MSADVVIRPTLSERTIVGIGGFPNDATLEYVLGLASGRRLLENVPTAGMEGPALTVAWLERLHGRAEMSVLRFSPWPPEDLRGFTLGHYLVLVTCVDPPDMLEAKGAVGRLARHGFAPSAGLIAVEPRYAGRRRRARNSASQATTRRPIQIGVSRT